MQQSAGAKCSQSMLIHGKTYSEDDFHKDPVMLQYGNRWMSLWEAWATELDCPELRHLYTEQWCGCEVRCGGEVDSNY